MRTLSNKTNFMYMADTPVVYHCHHFNLFLDQTINDALGTEEGNNLKIKVARSAAHQLLANIVKKNKAETVMHRLEAASAVFAAMGHGILSITGNKVSGKAAGEYLHYGFSWSQKYAKRITRLDTADAFATGFCAAALEIAHDLEADALTAKEIKCISQKAQQCEFEIYLDESPKLDNKIISKDEAESSASEPITGLYEDTIVTITNGLNEFTSGVAGDERGLVEAFGVYVTMHLSGYYNGISYEALKKCQHSPTMVFALGELFKESGHVCVFNTFGGMLLSPEWEALVGPPSGDPEELVAYLTAIGRALGFGKWCVKEFIANERFVLETSSTYEDAYCNKYCIDPPQPSEFFVQGAALAFMVLIHKLNWQEPIELTPELYDSLFKGGLGWQVEQTKGLSIGDDVTEVVVTRK